MTESIRLVFVDDYGLGRSDLAELVGALAGMKVLATVGRPDEARANDPELTIVDLRLDRSAGLALLCQRRAADTATPVVPQGAGELVDIYPDAPRRGGENPLRQLTEREAQILEQVMRGRSNKAIAKALAISHETVKLHVRHILAKLNVVSRVEAAVLAVELQMRSSAHPAAQKTARIALRSITQGS